MKNSSLKPHKSIKLLIKYVKNTLKHKFQKKNSPHSNNRSSHLKSNLKTNLNINLEPSLISPKGEIGKNPLYGWGHTGLIYNLVYERCLSWQHSVCGLWKRSATGLVHPPCSDIISAVFACRRVCSRLSRRHLGMVNRINRVLQGSIGLNRELTHGGKNIFCFRPFLIF